VLFFGRPLVPAEFSIVSGLSSFKDENGEVLPCFLALWGGSSEIRYYAG